MYKKPTTPQYGEMVCGESCGKLGSEEDVENAEKYDGLCEKCRAAGRGNIEVCLIFYKELHKDDVRHHLVYSRSLLTT